MTESAELAQLKAAVDGLDMPVDGDALSEGFGLLDRLTAKLTVAARDFDSAELWDLDGAASLAAWLRVRAGLTNRDATRHSATARRLRGCPVTAQAWLDGALTGGQVTAIVANLNDRTAGLFAEHEATLVPVLAGLDVRDTTAAMRDWAAKAKALLDDRDPAPETGRAHLSPTLDGRGRLDADLTTDAYQAVRAALRVAFDPKREGDERTPAQKRHDALLTVCLFYLDHQDVRAAARHRPHLNVTIDLEALTTGEGQGRFDDGTPIDAATAQGLACDASIHRVITKGRSEVLDYGRATRTVAAALFIVVAIRDQGCRFPGCDRPVHHCDAHHVHHWIKGGPTKPSNLVLLCGYHHHHIVHRQGWTLTMDPDATVHVTSPNGRCRTSRPPPALSEDTAA